ncbi:MAG: hypothetical protein EOP93_12475 [Lysobacteraceae bacterium]|nr:MAG: hypothetical protein EOP93_12475 [Xanthomonadaceae bacterium]
MTLFKYSFPLAPPPPQPQAQQSFDYTEFLLDLDPKWRQVSTDEGGALHFQSEIDGAALIISADFFDIPDDKAQGIAEQCLSSRLAAIQAASAKPVQVLSQRIKPHVRGGLEMSFASEVEGEHVHLHLGYVTARKLLNFSMVCQPGRQEAVALFNATVPGFRPRLP